MAYLLGASTAEADVSEAMTQRNQAYTHLKRAVDEIRNCGQYVFWRNDDRAMGYASAHKRQQNAERKAEAVEEQPAQVDAIPQQ